jgi:hypothetical protein
VKVKFTSGVYVDDDGVFHLAEHPRLPTYVETPSTKIDEAWTNIVERKFPAHLHPDPFFARAEFILADGFTPPKRRSGNTGETTWRRDSNILKTACDRHSEYTRPRWDTCLINARLDVFHPLHYLVRRPFFHEGQTNSRIILYRMSSFGQPSIASTTGLHMVQEVPTSPTICTGVSGWSQHHATRLIR